MENKEKHLVRTFPPTPTLKKEEGRKRRIKFSAGDGRGLSPRCVYIHDGQVLCVYVHTLLRNDDDGNGRCFFFLVKGRRKRVIGAERQTQWSAGG